MSKDERDWFGALRRAMQHHVVQSSLTSAQIRSTARSLHLLCDAGLYLTIIPLNTTERMAIYRNQSRTNAIRYIITTAAEKVANHLERYFPRLGGILRNLRTAENQRRAWNQATNPDAERIKAAFRAQTGTSLHAYMQCRSSRIFNAHVMNRFTNEPYPSLGGASLRDEIYRLRLWIISRVLYFYGLRNT